MNTNSNNQSHEIKNVLMKRLYEKSIIVPRDKPLKKEVTQNLFGDIDDDKTFFIEIDDEFSQYLEKRRNEPNPIELYFNSIQALNELLKQLNHLNELIEAELNKN